MSSSSSPSTAAGPAGTMFGQTVQSVVGPPATAIDSVLADIAVAWGMGPDPAPVPSNTVTVTAKKIPYLLLALLAAGVYFLQ